MSEKKGTENLYKRTIFLKIKNKRVTQTIYVTIHQLDLPEFTLKFTFTCQHRKVSPVHEVSRIYTEFGGGLHPKGYMI